MTFRRRQRSRHHHAAHQGSSDHAPPFVHPLVPQGEPELVTDAAALADVLAHAREMGRVAFDTEFIGETTYQPTVCLIQLATAQRVALIDPLRLDDLEGVWSLVADRAVETIVHAGASDISIVRRNIGRDPEGIVDVQVAAGFAGMVYPASLAKLVERYAGHGIAKGHTFTDWDARPLTSSQLRYAAEDVRYLPMVWSVLHEELERRGRLHWVESETATRLEDPHTFDPLAHARRIARGYRLTREQEAVLQALCVARDTIAQQENLPPRTTIPDGSLLEIMRSRPGSKRDLDEVRGLPRPIVARHGQLLLSVLAAHPGERTQGLVPRSRHGEEGRWRGMIDAMLNEAQRAATEMEISPQLVVTRGQLTRLVRDRRAGRPGDGESSPLFEPPDWRLEAFGTRIEDAGTKGHAGRQE